MYNVLIVEDHALIRFGLKTALETKDFIKEIYETSNAEDAIEIVKQNNINAIIMDLGLPSMNGIEATKIIKNIKKDIKVIILTSHNSEQEVIEAVKVGASAYCSKDINPDRLTYVIQSVMDGSLWFDSKISNVIKNSISEKKEIKTLKIDEEYNLTDREKQVLRLYY